MGRASYQSPVRRPNSAGPHDESFTARRDRHGKFTGPHRAFYLTREVPRFETLERGEVPVSLVRSLVVALKAIRTCHRFG